MPSTQADPRPRRSNRRCVALMTTLVSVALPMSSGVRAQSTPGTDEAVRPFSIQVPEPDADRLEGAAGAPALA